VSEARAGTVRRIVTEAVSHQPVAGARVVTKFRGFGPAYSADQAVAAADGAYQLLTEDTHADTLGASAIGYAGYEFGLTA